MKSIISNKKAEQAQDKANGKLASGLRIRTAADDSANLAISEKMRAQIRGLAQASHNIQDGIFLVQTADGALGSINDPTLQRMRLLASQSANGTLTDNDRQRIQEEIQQLKSHLNTIFKNSEFNTQKIFNQLPPQSTKTDMFNSPGILQGDTILSESGLVVTPGENQTMTFKLNDTPYSISLSPGNYTSQQLLDEINQKLQAAGTDVTASYSGQNIAFNSPTKVMDGFGSDMMEINSPYTSILYDMAKHGVISGATAIGSGDLSGGLTIISGSNDTLTLKVDGVDKSITLNPLTYNQADLLTEINHQLTTANIDVTASYVYGNQLQLMHNISGAGHTLTTISGNAYKDLFQQYATLSEYIVPGTYTTAAITGNKDLSSGITIVAGQNDQLDFFVDGVAHTVTLQAGSNLSVTNIVTDLNNTFTGAGLSLVASNSSGKLVISYNAPGTHTVNQFSGNACADLLYGTGTPTIQLGTYTYIEGDSTPQPVGYASVTGVTDLSSGVAVVSGENDTFTFRLDGTDHTIVLDAGNYSASSFVSQINSKLNGLNVTASLTSLYSGSGLRLQNTNAGGGVAQFPYSLDNFSGNGYDAFMTTTIPVPNTGVNSKAYVYGRADLFPGLTVTAGVNDTLGFQVNGVASSITLTSGSYSQASLLLEINTQLSTVSAGITASYSGSYLMLTANSSGNFQINNFTGNALDALLRTKSYVGGASYNTSNSTDAYIEGRKVLSAGASIHSGTNDTLSFALNNTMYNITLPAGNYDTNGLLTMVNQQLSTASLPVSASYNAKNELRLTYAPGVNGSYIIDSVGGNASYTLFYPGPIKSVTTEYDAEPPKTSRSLKIQIGANEGDNIDTGIPISMNIRSLGIKDLDLGTQDGAEKAITLIDQAMSQVSEKRATMGSLQNVLDYTLNNVTSYREQLTKTESNIRDVDIALEMVESIKSSILLQSSTTILSHANQNPQSILQLLQ